MKFIRYTEDDFNDLKDKTREQLEAELKDVYIRDMNYWMDQVENRQELIDELFNKLYKAINFIHKEMFHYVESKELLDILGGKDEE